MVYSRVKPIYLQCFELGYIAFACVGTEEKYLML